MRILAILSGVLVVFALVLGTAVWLLLQPGFAVEQAQRLIAENAGHRLTVGTSHVTLLPEPAIVLENVTLSEPGSASSPLLTAREMTLAVSLGAMVMRELEAETVRIDGAHINLAIDGSGKPNWSMHYGEPAALPDLIFNRASLAFVDERSGLALRLDGFTGTLAMATDGSLAVEGLYTTGGRNGSLGLTLASLKRLGEDGSPLSLSLSDTAMKFGFDGRLALTKAASLAGQATLEWPDRVSVTGPFEAQGRALTFKQARLDSFAGGGNGTLSINFAAQMPKLDADFELDTLNLAAFLPPLAFDGSWSERPLGLARLKQADVAARLKIDQLQLGRLALGQATMAVTLANGRLELSTPDLALYGGRATASLTIDSARAVPEIALSLAAEKLSLPGGTGDIAVTSIAVTSAGLSQAEIAGGLSGSASLTLANGTWNLPSFADLLTSAGKGIVSDWRPSVSAAAKFDELSASFTIADGIAVTSDLRILAPGINVTGSGEIDVLRHAVDLKAETVRPDGKPAFPVPLIFQGPWRAPRLYPDMPGILDDPAAAYRALSKLKFAAEAVP